MQDGLELKVAKAALHDCAQGQTETEARLRRGDGCEAGALDHRVGVATEGGVSDPCRRVFREGALLWGEGFGIRGGNVFVQKPLLLYAALFGLCCAESQLFIVFSPNFI